MNGPRAAYEVKPFPLSRRAIIDSGRIGKRKHTITGLFEADVTEARRILRDYEQAHGESLSFTAFVLACLGSAIDADRQVQAYRDTWGRLIIFADVDCTTLVEIELQGRAFPLAHTLRGINGRTHRSLHDEIRAVQSAPSESREMRHTRLYALFFMLPAFVRDLLYAIVSRSPHLLKKRFGTVMVSAVGMFGKGGGWGISGLSLYTLTLLLGGIAQKPGVVDGEIAIREYLSITLTFDHDIVDGAPAARFGARLKDLLESAYGLDEYR